MKNEFTPELIEKAKSAKSAAELIALAKENSIELTNEEAADYFVKLNPKCGDISDEELTNVAGGGCYNGDGRLVVTGMYVCDYWSCVHCGQPITSHTRSQGFETIGSGPRYLCGEWVISKTCSSCGHCSKDGPVVIVCNHPAHHA